MTPIERVSEKAQYLSTLGLSPNADLNAIRRAYKRLILEKHPDHGKGTADDVCQITQAYQFLKSNADDLGLEERPTRVTSIRTRPSVKPSETVFSKEVLEECKSHFSEDEENAQHVATMLHRTGRRLTYFVPNAPTKGGNVVVVATGELVDSRHAVPKVVMLHSRDVSNGVFTVPDTMCEDLFPGARSVQIQFGD